MTDQLFGTATALPQAERPERIGRWVLHRAGIVNVWQYDRAELAFAGGRVLLRGSNGAGKSKAMEVLLPFLLDGDTRKIDATARDRTSVYWLMTDGRPDGNHVGYVWLELRMTELAEGGETGEAAETNETRDRYLTIGAGLKASTSTRQSTAWYFLTEDVRVGESLHLGAEVSLDRLREQVGADAVTQSAPEHRRRVSSRLFGFDDEGRYASLVHLLHRLRDPNIGNRVEAGELAQLLRDALPPVPETALDKAGERFEALDQIRSQLEHVEKTALALERFLVDYASYARGRLAARAEAVLDAGADLRRRRREQERLGAEVKRVAAELEAAEADVDRLRTAALDAAAELEALQASEAYQQHRQLDDRRRLVSSKASEAEGSARHEAEMAELASSFGTEAEGAAARADDARQRIADTKAALARTAKVAGIDPAVLPPEAAGIPGACAVADGRRRAAQQVKALALRVARLAEEAERYGERAARSEADVTARQGETDEAEDAWHDATASWCAAVEAWAAAPSAVAGEGALRVALRQSLAALEAGAGDDDLAAVSSAARDLAAPVRQAAHRAESQAVSIRDQLAESLASLQVEHDALEAEDEVRPERSRYRDAERDPDAGAAFYELVEPAAGLEPDELAGLEAALESSGLLDAWVSAEGIVVHPSTHEILWRADAPRVATARTLAEVLVPANERVAALLETIALEEGASPFVTLEGRWSLPPLSGAWEKPSPEFLGTPARRAARARRLADLECRIAEERQLLEGAERELSEARAARHAVEVWTSELPPDGAVRNARAEWHAARRSLASARARYDDDRRRAEEARSLASVARTELDHRAAADSLPRAPEELEAVISAADELSKGLRRWQVEWRDLAQRLDDLDSARARHTRQAGLAARESERARVLRSELAREEAALRTLEEAVGATVAEVLRQIEETGRRKAEAETEEPKAQKRLRALERQQGEVATREEEGERLVAQASEVLAAAAARLQLAARLPGVAAAALGERAELEGELGEEALDVARRLADALADPAGAPVSDTTILNRLHALSAGLSSGYDVVENEEDGIKFVLIADDLGRHPLPAVAARVSADAAAARERLAAGERETIERFLLSELGEELRERLLEAHDLVHSANRALASVRSSHGKGAHLGWSVDEEAPDGARVAAKLLVSSLRSAEEDAALRDALMDLIQTERERDPAVSYAEHLRVALDYRNWHRFSVQVTDPSWPAPRVLSPRLGLSQGEQRVLSYLALFAAASAHFDSIGRGCPRLLLLDDAFAKVDEPTHERLLRLLVDLDLDFVVTSERMWGCHPKVPSLEIYEALRDPSTPGVALVHFHWDGHERHLVGI